MWPIYRISLVGYHCSIEFPCGVPLFYCCKYPTTYGVHVHTFVNDQTLRGPLLFFSLSLYLTHSHRLCTRITSEDRWEQRTDSRGPIVPIEKFPRRVWPSLYTPTFHWANLTTECTPLLITRLKNKQNFNVKISKRLVMVPKTPELLHLTCSRSWKYVKWITARCGGSITMIEPYPPLVYCIGWMDHEEGVSHRALSSKTTFLFLIFYLSDK